MMQTVHLQLTVEGQEIEAAVPLPAVPSPRRALLPTLQRLTDTLVNLAENTAASAGHTISCKKGCDACCRQMVPIAPAEAYALAALLDTLSPAHAARTLERFDTALDTLDAKGLLDRLRHRHQFSPEQLQQLDRDYFAAGINCPFLLNRACSIHPHRPLACREFLVTSPARECRTPGSGNVHQLPLPAKVSVALAQLDQSPWLPLTLARDFVAANPEQTPGETPAALLSKVLNDL